MNVLTRNLSCLGILAISAIFISPAFAVIANPDAEVLGLIQEIDQHEMRAAEVAQSKKNIDKKVIDYAKKMEKVHSRNLQKDFVLSQTSGIVPANTDTVVSQRNQGLEEMARLKALNGDEFASAYIVAMVNGHTQALALIDSKSGQIQNADLKKHVAKTRSHVAEHLKKAQKVQRELTKP